MGRKTRITREMILQAAYELLDEAGISAVAIKSIAAKLNCSTQPVSWQFGSMTELKKELFFYAADKMYGQLDGMMKGRPAVEAFFISGVHFLSIACDHPLVFRFLNVDDPMETIGEMVLGEGTIFSRQMGGDGVDIIAEQYGLPKEKIAGTVRDIVIYTYGVATIMMYDNFRMPREQACRMVYDMGRRLLAGSGIDSELKSFEDIWKELGNDITA